MRVRELMTGAPITVPPTMAVLDARQLMQKERIRHLLVTEGDRLVGIVTDRDIRLNLPSQATSLSVWELNYLLARLEVREIMARSVLRVGPDREAEDAARLMLEHRIGALPVVEDERLVGIITETDILRAFVGSGRPAAAARR
jgi:acetoin utilization protein AcuB